MRQFLPILALHNRYIAADPRAFSYFYIMMENGERVNFYIGASLALG